MLASFDHSQFELGELVRAKRGSVTVCIPTKETAETIESTVGEVAALREAGLVDQLLVVDADSADGTAALAAAAGAQAVREGELLPELGPVQGKGDAMWRALSVAEGETVVYLDGDVRDFGAHYVVGLLGPLLRSDRLDFVKGFYSRPLALGELEIEDGGGRVTELTAKPMLELIAPELAAFRQPLAGECAARRSLLEGIHFSTGYGVEIAMLVEVWRRIGIARMAQVGLGSKRNSHQSLAGLGKMSREVVEALATQAGGDPTAGPTTQAASRGAALGSIRPAAGWAPRLQLRPPMREPAGQDGPGRANAGTGEDRPRESAGAAAVPSSG